MSSINEKKRVYQMEERKNRKVVEHNDLITSIAKMKKSSLKIFEIAVSAIDTSNPPKNNTVYLSKSDLISVLELSSNSKYSDFKNAMDSLQKQAFFSILDKTGEKEKYVNIVPVPYTDWTNYDDVVTIRFDQAMMPYLIGFKNNFTQYVISDFVKLTGKHAMILYRLFSMYYSKYEKQTASREQLLEYKNPIISIGNLKKMTNTETGYDSISNFTRRVLDQPIKEINERTHFNIEYQKIKKSRKVTDIQFFISSDNEEQNNKSKQEGNFNDFLFEAMQKDYTMILMQNGLLTSENTQDNEENAEMFANLLKEVYPVYDELEKLRAGIVSTHIAYVAKNRSSDNKGDLTRYLKKSAESYLEKVKKQIEEQKNKPKKPSNSKKKPVRKEIVPDHIANPVEEEEDPAVQEEINKKLEDYLASKENKNEDKD